MANIYLESIKDYEKINNISTQELEDNLLGPLKEPSEKEKNGKN